MESLENYGLDIHCTMILEEYRERLPIFRKLEEIVKDELKKTLDESGILVTTTETRIKTEKSLAGKLERKGAKYKTLSDLTDIMGARVITFYSEDVDKIAVMLDRHFCIDWKNTVDKRKAHELDSFGYNSLHYICSVPETLYSDPEHPEINRIRFEIQLRTALQHVWAAIDHDTGYKTDYEIPARYMRNMNRIAGMLELADEQFSTIRAEITDYRRKMNELVRKGLYAEAPLSMDTFRIYLEMKPFALLMKRIAAINQAEIHEDTLIPYLPVLKAFGFKTIGDVDNSRKKYSDDAYQFATARIAGKDIDILSSTVALSSLLTVHILAEGGGKAELVKMMDMLYGQSDYNETRAAKLLDTASTLQFMNR